MTLMLPRWTPLVKTLIIVCAAVFVLQLAAGPEIISIFGLTPYLVLKKFFVWQVATYLFLHAGLGHLFVNMFTLWMFGSELERSLGRRNFLKFYFAAGMGAGLLSILVNPFSQIPTIGASGSIYGILMAYGMLYPNRIIYLYFLFPVKVKYFVAVIGAVAFLFSISAPGSTTAHIAHLGGMIFAFVYLKGWFSWSKIRQSYFRWRLNRMRQRFKVYENERRKSEDDFWIN